MKNKKVEEGSNGMDSLCSGVTNVQRRERFLYTVWIQARYTGIQHHLCYV